MTARCEGWKRGACPCKNQARIGHVTCGKHADQEERIEQFKANDPHKDGGR